MKATTVKEQEEHVCPVWVGHLLASPVRKLIDNPEKILSPYVKKGMNVLDAGCAMGFFSIPMAKMVGENGKVICVDLQDKMIENLNRKIRKTDLEHIIETRTCSSFSLNVNDLHGQLDFILASAVVHEVPDRHAFIEEVYRSLRNGGKLLIAEPKGHVTSEHFEKTIDIAQKQGFKIIDHPVVRRSHTAVLQKGKSKNVLNGLMSFFLF